MAKARLFALLVTALALAGAPSAVAGSDAAKMAATCAAVNLANWDLETKHLGALVNSDGWKHTAEGFRSLAIIRGMNEAEVDSHIAALRPTFIPLIKAWLHRSDPAREAEYEKRSNQCIEILTRAPEMAPYR